MPIIQKRTELFDPDKLPAFHDPFAGGGSLPLEAQRLGLEAHASELNPVAVLINKAMIEIPPKFAGQPPVNPDARKDLDHSKSLARGARGLAEDVRYYGQWMRDEAEKRIGHLYPKVADHCRRWCKGRPDLEPYVGREAHRHRVAVGTDGEEPQPGLRGCGGAARLYLHAVHEKGQGSLCGAGDRGQWRLPVHGEGRERRADADAAKRRNVRLSRGSDSPFLGV